jgi:DNA-binding response OmpR family regulator
MPCRGHIDRGLKDGPHEGSGPGRPLPRHTKALLVTAHVNRHIVNRMFECGVSGYIIKPFDEAELMRHLDFHAGRGRSDTTDSSAPKIVVTS